MRKYSIFILIILLLFTGCSNSIIINNIETPEIKISAENTTPEISNSKNTEDDKISEDNQSDKINHTATLISNPIASFEKERFEDQWKFINMSKTFDNNNRIAEVEWKIYSDNELINAFSTYNLNLTFNTNGIYKITLRVMDSYGNWSLPYAEEIFHTSSDLDQENQTDNRIEALNSYTIGFDGDVSFDESNFRAGDKSIKMVFSGDETHSVDLKGLFLDNNVKISFWINATDDISLIITVIGTNEENIIFSISKVYYPKIDQWQKITFTANTSYVNNLKISINSEDLILWIDDIEVNSYK